MLIHPHHRTLNRRLGRLTRVHTANPGPMRNRRYPFATEVTRLTHRCGAGVPRCVGIKFILFAETHQNDPCRWNEAIGINHR